ncbi:MAG TPA: sigma 54-interacting transcriptional regulator [Acidobacteriaceae bacterium]
MGYGLGKVRNESKAAVRTVLLASADIHFRSRLRRQLAGMRWDVREAAGGAEALAQLEAQKAEAMVLDSVLPDLEVSEFALQMRRLYPGMDLLQVSRGAEEDGPRSPRRNELLHALRLVQQEEGSVEPAEHEREAAEQSAVLAFATRGKRGHASLKVVELRETPSLKRKGQWDTNDALANVTAALAELPGPRAISRPRVMPLPEMVGNCDSMMELARMVRLVAPRSTSVLVEGDTGTGKELVAKAVHCLSRRAGKPFQVLNCAAIPEALLEAELFGHIRGAFTGAVQSRQGRIEAAHGGTLFLDEIGEMPLGMQAKMLRFLESGELQRVGDNETLRVDVRVVAASHQPLQKRATEGSFRLDLYHRLAVFPVKVPALRDRMEDVLLLAEYLLGKLGEEMPVKRLSPGAAKRLMEYDWPGNVRELGHVLERAAILAEDRQEIAVEEIRF